MNHIDDSLIERLKSEIRLSDIVSKKVKLKRQSIGKYSGLCPFHNEKTPSFTVNDDKGFYYCFGCGAKGDIFTFVATEARLTFIEAVEMLAASRGIEIPKKLNYKQAEVAEAVKRQRQSASEALKAAEQSFIKNLHLSGGKVALDYLIKQRGLSLQTIQEFAIGFAMQSFTDLTNTLENQSFNKDILADIGLIIDGNRYESSQDKKQRYWDRFRGRIIFPITNKNGKTVGFGGRILPIYDEDGVAKYLNSPESDLFNKGRLLYNYQRASFAAHKEKIPIIVVEGYMDVIGLANCGINSAVAPLGTSITESQLEMILGASDISPVFAMDGDKAGIKSMTRTLVLLMPIISTGRIAKFCILPENLDPDDYINKYTSIAFMRLVEQALDISQLLWRWCLVEFGITNSLLEDEESFKKIANKQLIFTPEKKAEMQKFFSDKVSEIKDHNLRKSFEDFFWQKIRGLDWICRDIVSHDKKANKLHKNIVNSSDHSSLTFRQDELLKRNRELSGFMLHFAKEIADSIKLFDIVKDYDFTTESSLIIFEAIQTKECNREEILAKLSSVMINSELNQLINSADKNKIFNKKNEDELAEYLTRLILGLTLARVVLDFNKFLAKDSLSLDAKAWSIKNTGYLEEISRLEQMIDRISSV